MKKISNNERAGWLDAGGVIAAWLCAAHCLLLPLFVGFLPLLGLGFLLDENAERIIIGLSCVIAGLSLIPAYFRWHGKVRSLILFGTGIGLVLLSHLFLEEDLTTKIVFLLSGAVLITAAHLLNRRLCRECQLCRS